MHLIESFQLLSSVVMFIFHGGGGKNMFLHNLAIQTFAFYAGFYYVVSLGIRVSLAFWWSVFFFLLHR